MLKTPFSLLHPFVVRNALQDLAILSLLRPTTIRHNGPGRKSIYTIHKRITSSRYTPQKVRKLGAKNGVGRPPKRKR